MAEMNELSEVLSRWHDELLDYTIEMKGFKDIHIREAYGKISAMSARASEMRLRVVRSPDKRAQLFRTQEIDHFLLEVERQFKYVSRTQAVMEKEWDISQKG